MLAKITRLTDRLSVASQIAASDIPEIAAAGYRTIINNRPDGEEPGQLPATEAQRDAEEAGLLYRYLPVTAATLTLAEVEEFGRLLSSLEGPVLAHCRSGTRCCLLWSATQLLKGEASAESLIQQAAAQGFEISALARFA
jgi:uncharacterized protein (TIGR01244 family)